MKKLLEIFGGVLLSQGETPNYILIFIMLSVGLEVVLRTFFNRPQIWVTEVTEVMLLYITFLGSAWLLREGGHVKVDIILNRLKQKTIAFLGIISSIIGIFVSIILTVFGFSVTLDYLQRGIYTPTAMEIPISAIVVVIPIGSLMLFLQFIRRTGRFIAGFFIESGKLKT